MSKFEVRVLGVTQLRVDGVDVALSAGKAALISALCLLRDRPGDGVEIADLIWDDQPSSAKKALQNQVRRLRSEFGPGLVETRAGTYQLGAEVEVVDAPELLRTSDPDWALTAWRGTPFKELVDLPLVVAIRDQLTEACLDLVQELAFQGDSDHKIRSFLASQKIGVTGRPALAVLADQPAEPDPLATPTNRRVLLSRGQEAAVIAITSVIESFTVGQAPRAVIVGGTAGSGKTTILNAVRSDVADRRTVLSAVCSESPAAANETIAALLEELPDMTELNEHLQMADRFIEALSGLGNPSTLIVDDAHWATVALFDLLDKASRLGGVDVVLGTRDPQALIDGLSGFAVEVVDAPELDQTAIEVLLSSGLDRSVVVDDVHDVAAEILFLTGGAPLYSVELIHDLGAARAFVADGGSLRLRSDHRVPRSLLDVISDQVTSLPQLTRHFVELVATLHTIGGSSTTAHLLDQDNHVTSQGERAGLVEARDDGGWTMHAEVARAVYEAMSVGARGELHAFAANILRSPAPLGAARHAMLAPAMPPGVCFDIVRDAADHAFELSDYVASLEMWNECTRLAEPLGLSLDQQLDIAIQRCETARRAGDPSQMDIMAALVELAVQSGDTARRAEAVGAICKLGASSDVEANTDFVKFVEETLLLDLTPSDRASVLVSTTQLYALNQFSMVRPRFDEAYDISRQLNDGELTRFVLPGAYMSVTGANDLETRQRMGHELLAQSLEDGDLNGEWEAHHLLFSCALLRGDQAMMRHHNVAATALPGSKSEPNKAAAVAYMTAGELHLRGDLDAAEREADRCLDLSYAVGAQRGLAVYGALIMAIRNEQGRLAEMQPVADMLHTTQPGIVGWKGVLAWVLSETGDPATAHDLLVDLVGSGLDSLPADVGHSAVLWCASMAAATTGDGELCDEFSRVLGPYARKMSWTATCSLGPVDLALGRMATASGNIDEAIDALRRAEVMGARNEWPAVEMRAQLALAEIDPTSDAAQQTLRSVYAKASQRRLEGVAQLARRMRNG